MGQKKGVMPKPYEDGQIINLKDRTPEERKRISQMGVEARRRKKEKKMALQSCMRQLLEMRTNSDKKKQILRQFGFEDEDLTNQTLLMVALFQKGMTGDVSAIREITQMMDKLEMFKNTGKIQNDVTINLVTQGTSYTPTEADEKEIWETENEEEWLEEDDDWGNEVYE